MPTYPATEPGQDTDTRCTACRRLLHDTELDRWACFLCEDTARTHITDLYQLYGQLSAKLAPGSGGTSNTGHVTGATRSAPLPVSLGALDLIGPGGIVTRLQTIEDDWRKTLGWTIATFRGNPEQTLKVVVPFLHNTVGWACSRYPDVADDLKLLRILRQRADSVVNGTTDTRVPVGCCPTIDDATGQPCALPLKTSPWALTIRCHGCGTSWQRDEWLRLGATIRGIPYPARAAA